MSETTYASVEQMIADLVNLPVGAIHVLSQFDFNKYIESRKNIGKKDLARLQGFVPAVIQRAADLGLTVGFELGLKQAIDDGVSDNQLLIQKGVGFDQLVKEAIALVTSYYSQSTHLKMGDFDPFKDEREWSRIFAKRNGLNADYQKLLGVSDKTPTEYPEGFKKFLTS